jgi:hypothetical protein
VVIQANLSPVPQVNAPLATYSARPSWVPILKVGISIKKKDTIN